MSNNDDNNLLRIGSNVKSIDNNFGIGIIIKKQDTNNCWFYQIEKIIDMLKDELKQVKDELKQVKDELEQVKDELEQNRTK